VTHHGIYTLSVSAALLFCFGCSSADEDEGPTTPPTSFESTFEGLQSRLFEGQGCTEAACHGSASAGGLQLTADVSFEQLVGVPSEGSSLLRVEPGERTRSYLYQKLLAASGAEDVEINGAPMPIGRDPISQDLLDALRIWIYGGAPRTGTVPGTAQLLGADLPPIKPVTITPLPKPDPQVGFQLEMPTWPIGAYSEREVCFASYFDVRDQVPDEFKDESGDFAVVNVKQLRQDPQSHHLILNISRTPVEEIHAPEFGDWACRGGELNGESCEPTDLESCGTGHCATEPVDGFACIGFGPAGAGAFRNAYPIGGAQKAQDYDKVPGGVFSRVPLHGILFWNSHAFNITDDDHMMNGRLNYLFATDARYRSKSLGRFSAGSIFLPSTAPYEREELCSTVTLPQGAHLFSLSSHTHQRGESFKIFHPDGSLLYENYYFNDPVRKRFEPPLVFDSEEEEQRSLRYCAVYNNGVNPDGSPNPETVTRASRLPDSVNIQGVPGLCSPIACAAGKIGATCSGDEDHAACDSEPDAGDGVCDACAITGGESTENEMFLIIGNFYELEEEPSE
jgi:hypothetical protein